MSLEQLQEVLAGRYAIGAQIGAGGMATVYAADDLRHRRKVALKVLRPELAEALGAERFLREIETSASLRHPHILPLYDSGGAGRTLYFVMPLVEGESLRDRLAREHQLPVADALQIAREVGDALGHAHGRGIIHRDIKPENVLLEHGHAVVADFGIAQCRSLAPGEHLTQLGLAIGTPAYMSPEQAAGERDLDGRADLYSLACVVFEMLAGQPPFGGMPAERTVYRHMVETPPLVTQFRPAVPGAVAVALQRALAKAPEDRFGSIREFIEAMEAPAPARPAVPSVAVLPFLNLSTDPDNEYFSDGMTEDVIAQLAKVHSLKVVSRTSVMPFKDRGPGLPAIASRLGVRAVLDGSVRRAGQRVRIVAQLIDAAADRTLWSETFDRELTDIFAIQSEVALRIVEALQATLSSDERARIGREPTRDVHAYELYLQGRQHFSRHGETGLRRAVEYFDRALERDDEFALAHAGVALALSELVETGLIPSRDAEPRARAAAARALELDSELGEAHAVIAYGRMVFEGNAPAAEAELQRALELSPNSADALDLYGRFCAAVGRFDEAITLLERAREVDPLTHRVDVATAYLRAGRNQEALLAATRAVNLDHEDPRASATLGWALIGVGRVEEGLASLEHAVELAPGTVQWLGQLGQAYGTTGRTEQARALLQRLEAEARTRFVPPLYLAHVHLGLGQHEEALQQLEKAATERAGALWGLGGSFLFAPLRGHPRFQRLIGR